MKIRILNYVFFYAGWCACAFGAGNEAPLLGPVVVAVLLTAHLFLIENRRSEIRLIIAVGLFGSIVESILKAIGFLNYAGSFHSVAWLAPLWITALWMLLASTMNFSFYWLNNRYGLAATLGAIGGPFSYVAGARIGAIGFPHNLRITIIVLALIWGAALPLLYWLKNKLELTDEKRVAFSSQEIAD